MLVSVYIGCPFGDTSNRCVSPVNSVSKLSYDAVVYLCKWWKAVLSTWGWLLIIGKGQAFCSAL